MPDSGKKGRVWFSSLKKSAEKEYHMTALYVGG